MMGKAQQAADQVRQKAEDVYEDASEWAQDTYERASDWASDAYSQQRRRVARWATVLTRFRQCLAAAFQSYVSENPMVVGLVGLAAGLLLGALLPRTRRENEMFGEWADEVRNQRLRYAREAADRGREYVEERSVVTMLSSAAMKASSAASLMPTAIEPEPQSNGERAPVKTGAFFGFASFRCSTPLQKQQRPRRDDARTSGVIISARDRFWSALMPPG